MHVKNKEMCRQRMEGETKEAYRMIDGVNHTYNMFEYSIYTNTHYMLTFTMFCVI